MILHELPEFTTTFDLWSMAFRLYHWGPSLGPKMPSYTILYP